MSTVEPADSVAGEIAVLSEQVAVLHRILHRCAGSLTQEESLIQPQPCGNCLNWIVGHLVWVYDRFLPAVGQPPVLGDEALKRYERGSEPLRDPGEALPLPQLLAAWDEASRRLQTGLAALTPERLRAVTPYSLRNNPGETVRSLLATLVFHQSYHVGQIGMLRRMAGKPGVLD